MSITIPTSASQAWHDLIKNGLATDEYSYLVFDVKKAETDPNKKVQVFMKVYVPEEKRKTATQNVMAAMQKEGYAVEQRISKKSLQPEIDIQITKESDNNVQKVQVIRVLQHLYQLNDVGMASLLQDINLILDFKQTSRF